MQGLTKKDKKWVEDTERQQHFEDNMERNDSGKNVCVGGEEIMLAALKTVLAALLYSITERQVWKQCWQLTCHRGQRDYIL